MLQNQAMLWKMRSVFMALSLTCFFSMLATSQAQPAAKKMVIVGDSLTEGYGVPRERAFPALLQKKIDALGKNWQVVNAGISGSTSASALSRVRWTLNQKPALIVIAFGANDGLRGLAVKPMEENLSAAVEACKKAGVTVILAGVRLPPNYGAKYTGDFQAAFARVARKAAVPLIPSLLEGVEGRAELNQADGIHPNEKGHALLAETVFNSVRKYL